MASPLRWTCRESFFNKLPREHSAPRVQDVLANKRTKLKAERDPLRVEDRVRLPVSAESISLRVCSSTTAEPWPHQRGAAGMCAAGNAGIVQRERWAGDRTRAGAQPQWDLIDVTRSTSRCSAAGSALAHRTPWCRRCRHRPPRGLSRPAEPDRLKSMGSQVRTLPPRPMSCVCLGVAVAQW